MAEAPRTDHETLETVRRLPAGFLAGLTNERADIRPESVARARRHVDAGLWQDSAVAEVIAEELLLLSV